jgi:hypothetical protein
VTIESSVAVIVTAVVVVVAVILFRNLKVKIPGVGELRGDKGPAEKIRVRDASSRTGGLHVNTGPGANVAAERIEVDGDIVIRTSDRGGDSK